MTVAGTYDITIQTPMGEQKGQFTVTPEGDGFTGQVTNPMMGAMPVENGKIAGDTITWTMAMTVPVALTLEGEATVSGDAISGKVQAGAFGSLKLEGVRAG